MDQIISALSAYVFIILKLDDNTFSDVSYLTKLEAKSFLFPTSQVLSNLLSCLSLASLMPT